MGHFDYPAAPRSPDSGTSLAATGIGFRVVPAFSHSYFPADFLSSRRPRRLGLCQARKGTKVIVLQRLTFSPPGTARPTCRADQ